MDEHAVVAEFDEGVLGFSSRHSDRFVYSKYFVPLALSYGPKGHPLLSQAQAKVLEAYASKYPELAAVVTPEETPAEGRDGAERPAPRSAAKPAPERKSKKAANRAENPRTRAVAARRALAQALSPARAHSREEVELLLNLLKSDVGYVFMDRTRIRPAGFALGEHVYTLALAPGEEVVLEQKTYSKRQTTFEEQTELERQTELELASSLSTEIQEGLDQERSRSTSDTFAISGTASGGAEGVSISVQPSYTETVTDASSDTARRSLKDSATSSQKVAAKYRAAHKITFKVSKETGFEQSAKRTIRNPNRYTPLQVEFFKRLQVLQMSQERYGVRLCWAPAVRDPAFDFVERIRLGREATINQALAGLQLPARPTAPTKANKPPVYLTSGQVTCDKWGVTNDMSAAYDLSISPPAGYWWNGDAAAVKASVQARATSVNRSWGWHVVGEPWQEGSVLKLRVHVGVDWVIGKRGSISLEFGATFVPDPNAHDPAYQAVYDQYQAQLVAWQQQVDSAQQKVLAEATKRADEWAEEVRQQFNPVGELMNRVISHFFPPGVRDEYWEIDLWRNLFDWEAAAYVVFPGWWNPGPLRDWTKDASDFINASWAKLYLPVKVGFEHLALRWIVGRTVEQPLDTDREATFSRVVQELEDYRSASFGDPTETAVTGSQGDCPELEDRYLCLGRWQEVMPTDGTHVEVVQGATTARDEYSAAEEALLARLRTAHAENEEQDAALKKKLVAEKNLPAKVEVIVTTDDSPGS